MLKYTLIMIAILSFFIFVLWIIIGKRRRDELNNIEKRANNLANSERARHMRNIS